MADKFWEKHHEYNLQGVPFSFNNFVNMIETWVVIQRNKGVESKPSAVAAVATGENPPTYNNVLTKAKGAVNGPLQRLQQHASDGRVPPTSLQRRRRKSSKAGIMPAMLPLFHQWTLGERLRQQTNMSNLQKATPHHSPRTHMGEEGRR